MPPFPRWYFRGGGGIDQSGIRPEGSGRQAEGTTGGIKSKCGTEKRMDGWRGERKGEKEETGGGGFKPGRVVALEMGLPLGLATLSKSLQL